MSSLVFSLFPFLCVHSAEVTETRFSRLLHLISISHTYSSVNEGARGAAAELADVAGPGVRRITTNNSSWSFLLGTMICGLSNKI